MTIKIWSPKHLHNHAMWLNYTLLRLGYQSGISGVITDDKDTLWVLYCPQVLMEENNIVPEKYIVYNTEHEARFLIKPFNKYLFEKAIAVWSHTLKTTDIFHRYYPNIATEIVPAGLVISKPPQQKKNIDVLFYGSMNERRIEKLSFLQRNGIDISVTKNLFGTDLLQMLSFTKIVINLHYNKNNPLETFRIHEALSCGCSVISESSDLKEFDIDYKNFVHFIDDIYVMTLWIKHLLNETNFIKFDVSLIDNINHVNKAIKKIKLWEQLAKQKT